MSEQQLPTTNEMWEKLYRMTERDLSAAKGVLAAALTVIRAVDDTGLLYKHNMEVDATVANFLTKHGGRR